MYDRRERLIQVFEDTCQFIKENPILSEKATIIISDNGCGFRPTDDSDGHTALNNIRQRLEMMCSGSLTIPDSGGQ